MGEITADQIYSVFGDLTKAQQAQQSTLAKIEGLVSDKFTSIAESMASVKDAVVNLTKKTDQARQQQKNDNNDIKNVAQTIADNQNQQLIATQKLDKTLSNSLKSISSAFLTKEGQEATEPKGVKKKEQKVEIQKETDESKQLKLTRKELVALNTKMGMLVKDFQEARKEKKDGGLLKFLTPLLLIFGGVAALAYATQKFPFAKKLLDQLKQGGIKEVLSNLLSKVKPQDKSVTEWLRGLPFIGRFFDIYDAFKSFTKGDWKQGLKHLAFAIPGAEFIMDILGTSKKAFLAPGGGEKFIKNFSIQKVYDNIVSKVSDAFSGITSFFSKIQAAFMPMMEGTWEGINTGLTTLSDYFPILTPVVNFIKGMTDAVFESSIATAAQQKKPAALGKITLVDVAKETFTKIYDGISGFFQKIAIIFDQIGVFLTAIGDVFSGDYGKQAMALRTIESFSPGAGSFLRTALNVADSFRQLDIKEGDNLMDILWKLGTQGISTKGRFSKDQTFGEEQKQLQSQIEALPEGSAEREQLQIQKDREKAIMEKASAVSAQTSRTDALQEEYRPQSEFGAYADRITQRASEAYKEYDSVIMGAVGAGVGLVEQMGRNVSDIFYSITGQWDRRNEGFYKEQQVIMNETQGAIDEADAKLRELDKREEKFKTEPSSTLRPVYEPQLKPSESNTTPLRGTTANNDTDFDEIMEKHNKPLLQKLDKLSLLEDIAIKLGYNNEHLASIDKSNANMERMPASQTSIIQGGTNITFGGSSSTYKNGRKAFEKSAFSL